MHKQADLCGYDPVWEVVKASGCAPSQKLHHSSGSRSWTALDHRDGHLGKMKITGHLWWSSRSGSLCRSSDRAWPGLRAAGGGSVFCLAPTHCTLPIPLMKEPAFPRVWNGPASCLHEIIEGLSYIIEQTCSVVLCTELELKHNILSLTVCAELYVGNCLDNCPGNFFDFFFLVCLCLDITT